MKIKIPWFVDTDNQNVWVLFAFIRRIYVTNPYVTAKDGLNFYLSDIIRILDSEDKDIAKAVEDHVKPGYGRIGRILSGQVCIWLNHVTKDTTTVELTDDRAIRVWCYLMGVTNKNIIDTGDRRKRPFTMSTMDKDFFPLSSRQK